jgi:ankyrin repeat protein
MEEQQRKQQEALVDAIMLGNVGHVSALLDAGASPQLALDSANVTPLHFAAQGEDVRIVKVLLKRGASKQAKTYPDGQTPRDIALMHAHHDMLCIL